MTKCDPILVDDRVLHFIIKSSNLSDSNFYSVKVKCSGVYVRKINFRNKLQTLVFAHPRIVTKSKSSWGVITLECLFRNVGCYSVFRFSKKGIIIIIIITMKIETKMSKFYVTLSLGLLTYAVLVTNVNAQTTSAQQCAANLACSIDYNQIFQTKLDNVSHYTELEIALFRLQVNNILQPLQAQMRTLESNTTLEISSLNGQVANVQKELAYDR